MRHTQALMLSLMQHTQALTQSLTQALMQHAQALPRTLRRHEATKRIGAKAHTSEPLGPRRGICAAGFALGHSDV
jgi:hypothetical protein